MANTPITAALRSVKADSIGCNGTPSGLDSEKLYIEGNSLDVLKLLRETYLGKVTILYIDIKAPRLIPFNYYPVGLAA